MGGISPRSGYPSPMVAPDRVSRLCLRTYGAHLRKTDDWILADDPVVMVLPIL